MSDVLTTAEVIALKPVEKTVIFSEPSPGMDNLIQAILGTKRAHNSTGELNFVAWLYKALETIGHKGTAMAEGAVVVTVGTGGKNLFSCHLDTVHNTAESDGSMQKLFYDENFGHIFCGDKASTCLGADDGAGIYIMLNMIEAKVRGTYIFHRGEERGGLSAHAMRAKHKDFLKQFDTCIAFDRPNDYEVIITQGGADCASPDYGNALAAELKELGLSYEISRKGVFTDSKVYRDVIPGWINLGVGYANQHTNQEFLDWNHLLKLTEAAIKLPWDTLKPVRKPVEIVAPSPSAWKPKNKMKGFAGFLGDGYKGYYGDDFDDLPPAKVAPIKAPTKQEEDLESGLDIDFETMSRAEIDEYTCDEEMTNAIMRIVVELDAERARVSRLQMLLGM